MTELKKGALVASGAGTRVDFAFNPTTVVMKKTAKWTAVPRPYHRWAPPPQFVGAEPQSVELTVLFDSWTSPTPTVVERVEVLLSWTRPTPNTLNTDKPQPPLVKLEWGGVATDLLCYVQSVIATYLLFDDQGQPTRATVAVILEETPPEARGQNPTSGGEPGTRHRTAVGGDSLASVAQQEYGDASMWRALAIANDVDDPMRLAPGRHLTVPPQATARRLAAIPGEVPRA